MKNAIQYKDHWLTKGSTCYELFEAWKNQKDSTLAKVARKKFEDQFKATLQNYDILTK